MHSPGDLHEKERERHAERSVDPDDMVQLARYDDVAQFVARCLSEQASKRDRDDAAQDLSADDVTRLGERRLDGAEAEDRACSE